ncbi:MULTISPECIES: hypothetical protein [unclassified Mesorhizobium]|uniref:hypothetical protein n=1 Tax=unclassified Mesorhizobium TaxID=325217 RepID=UPI000FD310C6|nr:MULTISPECIES: hypothetical protein [unclassified Mesorhizobium]RVB72128.1 hypothetical protein EN885_30240 [Mesorhizobium sp. M6A.T.Cr.TU.014.01.1.1]RWP96417.1 MAG: hypothetical protein EOR90_30015 [Mesorhizobium sp.]RWQ01485.1 MAG: hypothetical protein EOR91_23370 [Mesorhizobium sp.]
MQASLDLTGARLKVARAKKHFDDLRQAVTTYLAEEPYPYAWEPDSEIAGFRVVVREKTPPPAELALLVGDTIHNARAALDHLAVAMAIRNGANAVGVKETYFPITESDQRFKTSGLDKIKHLSPADRQQIAASKPYQGGTIRYGSFINSTLLTNTPS